MAKCSGLTLRQAEVGGKSNEHTAALGLLKAMALEGRVVTGDAMFWQRDLCAQLLAGGGHYFVVVKENQPELLRDVGDAFTRAADPALSPSPAAADQAAVHRAPRRGQARRPGGVPPAAVHRLLNDYLDWPGVAQVCRVECEVRRVGREPSREVAYAITSVPRGQADAATLLGWWRGHWGIENRSHYVRDVTMGDDASRIRTGSAPQVLAAFRNAAMGWLRARGADSIAAACDATRHAPPIC
jgi:predicted transposase YbfD/YdcC